jgi:peptidoglycan/xylan/chitin deacetylase (PgdA/CDA1 family)
VVAGRRERDPTRFKLSPRPYYQLAALYDGLLLRSRRRGDAAAIPSGLTILAYHRISRERDVLAVTPKRFRRQLELVLELGARFVALTDALDLLRSRPTEARVAVTFDDGYLDNLEVALPILEELEVPAAIFLVSAIAGGRSGFHWYRRAEPEAIRWDDARAATKHPLLEFQAHGVEHLRLTALDETAARSEIACAREELERELGTEGTVYCYAAGLFGEREVRLVREAGYRAAVTCAPGVNAEGADPFRLKRLMVSWADDERRFAAKLALGGLPESPLARWARLRRRLERRAESAGA